MSDTQPVVDVGWVARQQPSAIRLVDLRWALSGPSALEKYRAGHIPGAVYVDMERDLSRPGGPGRHPFPTPEDFARVLGRIGVGPETHVVVYDDSTGSVAARLWFMLRVHGNARAAYSSFNPDRRLSRSVRPAGCSSRSTSRRTASHHASRRAPARARCGRR